MVRRNIGDPEEPGRDRAGNRKTAQEAVAQHIYRKALNAGERPFINWRQINVIWVNPARGQFDWEAVVEVNFKPDKIYRVTYTRSSDELKVDTYTRRHVPRFY
jgi:hypothetical protein